MSHAAVSPGYTHLIRTRIPRRGLPAIERLECYHEARCFPDVLPPSRLFGALEKGDTILGQDWLGCVGSDHAVGISAIMPAQGTCDALDRIMRFPICQTRRIGLSSLKGSLSLMRTSILRACMSPPFMAWAGRASAPGDRQLSAVSATFRVGEADLPPRNNLRRSKQGPRQPRIIVETVQEASRQPVARLGYTKAGKPLSVRIGRTGAAWRVPPAHDGRRLPVQGGADAQRWPLVVSSRSPTRRSTTSASSRPVLEPMKTAGLPSTSLSTAL